ncbi:MAG: protein O-mannosyl-transferase family [Endomicrobiales bacterium]
MLVFFVTFILYLFTLFPGVAPYRDTGEMVSVAHTLGIAHPPGYPLYTLLSKLFLFLLPWGNAGYRLNVLSALAGAGTGWLMYRIFTALQLGKGAAFFLSLLFSVSYLQWYLSLVSEMYTLNTLFAAAVVLCAILLGEKAGNGRPRPVAAYLLLSFIFGAGLGARMDLLLAGPGIAWIVFSNRKQLALRHHAAAVLLFCAGLSVFLYLVIRSNRGPFIDWNHPATLSHLWGTLTRKTHGGTLDLVSTPYAAGENFPATLLFYFKHLWSGFAYAGLPLGLVGLYSLWKRKRDLAIAAFTAWVFSGPVFIYLSNMPPNTHALAILEAHFLVPNLFFALFIAEGFRYLVSPQAPRGTARAALACAAVLALFNAAQHFPELNKRKNFIAYDYARSVLRSLPRNAVLVMKKDVQLFALWNQQLVEKRRPDIAVVSQGLCGSPWYRDGFRKLHPGIHLGPLRGKEDWQSFLEMNEGKDIYFTSDAEYVRPQGYSEEPDGLVSRIHRDSNAPRAGELLHVLYPYRGRYRYTAYREFFTPDLIEGYARSFVQLGLTRLEQGKLAAAREEFYAALRMQPLLPVASNYAAFTCFQEGKYPEALAGYLETARQYEALLSLSEQYNSLPEVKDGLRKDLSDVCLSAGVCSEKMQKDDESLSWYRKALDIYPGQEKAYFNRAVIYWRRNDWQRVAGELESALKINPQYREAAYFLEQARQRLRQQRLWQ